MTQLILLDAAPDPVSMGALLAVVFLVIGLIVLLTVGLVLFLWYRKRNRRAMEMIRLDPLSTGAAHQGQPNNPNQP